MRVAPNRRTRASLSAGTAVSAACFAIALLLELAGRDGTSGDPSDLVALSRSLVAFEPWGWATLGTLAVIATPVVGLVATVLEYRSVADRRTVLTALAVLAILGLSLALALLARPS